MPSRGNARREAGMKFIKDIATGAEPSSSSRLLAIAEGFVHDHPRHWFTVLFLFRRIELVRFQIHRDCVHRVLHAKVFELTVVIGIILVKNGNRSAIARDIDAPKTGIELDDVRSASEGKKRNWDVLLQIENGHQLVSLASEERAVMLRIERHSVVPLAFSNGMTAHHRVGYGIDDGENALVLQIDVYLFRYRVVLRHPRFALKVQRLHDL